VKELTAWGSELSASSVSVGRAIANTRFYLLDEQGDLVSPGRPGELWIGGAGVALGYLADAARSAAAFVVDPFAAEVGLAGSPRMYRTGDRARWLVNGELQVLGRLDQQVKLRGYRVELADIEQQLLSCCNADIGLTATNTDEAQAAPERRLLASAAVVLQQDSTGMPVLVAFAMVAPAAAGVAMAQLDRQLRGALARRLPDYMVPAAVVCLTDLPLTPNGKIDRRALPELYQDAGLLAQLAQSSSAERAGGSQQSGLNPQGQLNLHDQLNHKLSALRAKVHASWQRVLGERPLSGGLSFFAQGGNSMSLVLLAQELDQQFPGLLDVADLFANPSISAMSQLLAQRQPSVSQAAGGNSGASRDLLWLPADYLPLKRQSPTDGSGLATATTRITQPLSPASRAALKRQSKFWQLSESALLLAVQALLLHKVSQQQCLTMFYQLDDLLAVPVRLDFSELVQSDLLLDAVRAQLQAGEGGALAATAVATTAASQVGVAGRPALQVLVSAELVEGKLSTTNCQPLVGIASACLRFGLSASSTTSTNTSTDASADEVTSADTLWLEFAGALLDAKKMQSLLGATNRLLETMLSQAAQAVE